MASVWQHVGRRATPHEFNLGCSKSEMKMIQRALTLLDDAIGNQLPPKEFATLMGLVNDFKEALGHTA